MFKKDDVDKRRFDISTESGLNKAKEHFIKKVTTILLDRTDYCQLGIEDFTRNINGYKKAMDAMEVVSVVMAFDVNNDVMVSWARRPCIISFHESRWPPPTDDQMPENRVRFNSLDSRHLIISFISGLPSSPSRRRAGYHCLR